MAAPPFGRTCVSAVCGSLFLLFRLLFLAVQLVSAETVRLPPSKGLHTECGHEQRKKKSPSQQLLPKSLPVRLVYICSADGFSSPRFSSRFVLQQELNAPETGALVCAV